MYAPSSRKYTGSLDDEVHLTNLRNYSGALYAFGDIGWKYFLVFICAGPVGAGLIWWYAPETNGKTLEEIGGLFGDDLAIPELHATDESHLAHKAAA